jgi:muramoyltetrapeptide carboxypeptidase
MEHPMNIPRRKPPRLSPGGTIAVTAPASPVRDPERLRRGLQYVESHGYHLRLGESLNTADGYLAGPDRARADELNRFFADPEVEAIFCVRGGYGTMRLLELLDWDTIRRNPKIVVGFSDITALQWALIQYAGLPSISGPMVSVDFAEPEPQQFSLFWSLLSEPDVKGILWNGKPGDQLTSGSAEGILLPGTLSLAAALCGTPYQPMSDEPYILLLEDIGEEPYRIDRMLCQLLLSGVLRNAAGIAFGAFTTDTTRSSNTPTRPLEIIFMEYVTKAGNIPSVMNVPYGHMRKKLCMPVGLRVQLDADHQNLVLAESFVE